MVPFFWNGFPAPISGKCVMGIISAGWQAGSQLSVSSDMSDRQSTCSAFSGKRRRCKTAPNYVGKMSAGHDVTGSDVAEEEAWSRRLDRDAAIVVSASAALTSFQNKSSEELHMHVIIIIINIIILDQYLALSRKWYKIEP